MKAYISIDDPYPVFNLAKKNPANVQIEVDKVKLATWKSAFTSYVRVQKEIEALVNHYEPARLKAPRPDKGKFTDVRHKVAGPC